MLLPLMTALALQQVEPPPVPPVRPDTVQADSSVAADTIPERGRSQPRRIPVTAEHERTAFLDPAARALLLRAREARLAQDTLLVSYSASAYQRVSVGMALRRLARDRLFFREEQAVDIHWDRDRGVRAEVQGYRRAIPAARGSADPGREDEPSIPVPYLPGQETLWVGTGVAELEVDDRGPVNPLASGAEAYYRYSTGDSVTVRLPDGREIHLRELRIRPREPRWNLSVGSLLFDMDNARIVRAVYRLAAPLDIWAEVEREEGRNDAPRAVRMLLNPLRATVRAVTVEYGLEDGRFWLPRTQTLEAEAQVSFVRAPLRFEQRFTYRHVNGLVDVPEPDPVAELEARLAREAAEDSSEAGVRVRRRVDNDSLRAERDSLEAAREARRDAECEATGSYTYTRRVLDGQVPMTVSIPCDAEVLASSPALPASIFDDGELTFGSELRDELIREALALDAQAGWSPMRPVVHYGMGNGLLRYNRVEGLAPAVRVEQQLGNGYTASTLARLGTADLRPTAELSLARDDGRRVFRGSVYRRLVAASDWGEPLGLGSSMMAFAFGRDDGLYYRAWGAELTGEASGGLVTGGGELTWRLFAERQSAAEKETDFHLGRLFDGDREFLPNIEADPLTVLGFGWRYTRSFGLDPSGFRTFLTIRGEGGTVGAGYARGMADVTFSRPIAGPVDGAITLSGGSSAGGIPVQRLFYLGGPWSVRALDPGTAVGEAFWMGRGELALGRLVARPVLFYDVGWAGPRRDWRAPGTPLSSVGVGYSVMDGMVRMDLSRSIRPVQKTRLDLYLEARF